MKKKKKKKSVNYIYIIFAAVALFFVSSIFVLLQNFKRVTENNLIGTWQASPVMGSGWDDRYHFYENGTFDYVENANDCDANIRQISGTWKLKNGQFELHNLHKKVLVESENKEPLIPCGRDQYFSEEKVDEVFQQKLVWLKLDDLGGYQKEKIVINGKEYWKFDTNPIVDKPIPLSNENTKYWRLYDDYVGIEKAFEDDLDVISVSIKYVQLSDRFATVNASYIVLDGTEKLHLAGLYVVYKDSHGQWRVLENILNTPLCDKLDEFNVPAKFYGQCSDSNLNELRVGELKYYYNY